MIGKLPLRIIFKEIIIMKKFLFVSISLLLVTLILVFCFSSCWSSKIVNTTVAETEEHFNTLVNYFNDFIKPHITCNCEINYEYGKGEIFIWTEESQITIWLYNSGDVEEYYVACQIMLDTADDRLNADKEEYQIIRMILSELICDDVTEKEFDDTLIKLKNNKKIVNLVNSEKRYKTECSTKFDIVNIRYSLSYIGNDDLKYVEVMKLGGSGFNNYPKYTYK